MPPKKVKGRRPPGRPWNRPSNSSKVCLLCLRRFDRSFIFKPDSSSSEDESDYENGGEQASSYLEADPLSDKFLPLENGPAVKPPKRKRIKLNLYLKFLSILSRYLQIRTKRFRTAAIKNKLEVQFCDTCENNVRKLIEVYRKWSEARLYLHWRLVQIADTVKSSKTRLSGKLSQSLVKSLSTQLHVSSSNVVDILRKQLAVRCTAKCANMSPNVSISKNSCINATKHKLKYPIDHMKQYMMSLIVIFALAVPPVKKTQQRSITAKKPGLTSGSLEKVKPEIEKTENVRLTATQIKTELGMGGTVAEDNDHFGGGGYSPLHSPPNSPDGAGNQDDDVDKDKEQHSDSDWSMKGDVSGNDSDVEFSVNSLTTRRWNLRRRRSTRLKGDDENQDVEEEEGFEPGVLPPLRAPRGSKLKKGVVDESEKRFSCNLCGQKFLMERSLKRHLGHSHAFLMQYNCTKCPLKFKKSKDLQIHIKKAHKRQGPVRSGRQLPYFSVATPCTVCQKMFPSQAKMRKHRKVHKINETQLTCEICGKIMLGQFRMDFHMKTHNRPDKPFKCTKCPRSFSKQEGLDLHLKIHEQKPDWVPWVRKKKPKSEMVPREAFKCEIPGCGKSFYKKANLTIHMSLHAKSFPCEACSKICLLPRDLRKHLQKTHETEKKCYFCLFCDKSFTLMQTYDLHRKVAHPTRAKIGCDEDYCTEEFDDTDTLREHLKSAHVFKNSSTEENTTTKNLDTTEEITKNPSSGDNISTENTQTTGNAQAGENTKTESSHKESGETNTVDQEYDISKLDIFTCERCNWSFCKKIHLTLHKLVHTPRNANRMFQCTLCEKAFAVVDSLQTHYNTVHGPKIKPYLCLICGVRFHRRESFIPHMRMHKRSNTLETFECSVCSEKCPDSASFRKHIKTHKPGQQPECEDCKLTFSNRLTLLNHRHEFHGLEKPHKCDVEGCNKAFFTGHQLKDHKICHEEATFQCTMCPRKFRRRHNLDDHILVHKQEKNHICDVCGKAFVKKSSLNLHLAIHREDKKYKCSYCSKTFCRKFARDCHLRTHTKEKPFSCEICGRPFGQYTSLKNHLKVHQKVNSSVVKRVPFGKTLGVGKPLKPAVADLEDYSLQPVIGSKNNDPATIEDFKVEESMGDVPTDSGIIHAALQAAFNDIHSDLESVVDKVDEESYGGDSTANAQEKEEVNSDDEEVSTPVKRRRGRPKKSKDYVCGICGKGFVREKPYKAHVDRHLSVDAVLATSTVVEDNNSRQSTQKNTAEERQSLQETLIATNNYTSPIETTRVFENQQMMVPANLHNSMSFTHPQPVTRNSQQQLNSSTKGPRRGRDSNSNRAPGSRLARIVEDVIEAATNNQYKNAAGSGTNISASSSSTGTGPQNLHQQYQNVNLSNPQPEQQHHLHHPSQVQSPHQHSIHSGSERSTSAGSPAPNLAIPTTTSTPTLPFSATSFLSPFLYANPYLLPRAASQAEQHQQQHLLSTSQSQQIQQQSHQQHTSQQAHGFSNMIPSRQQHTQLSQQGQHHNMLTHQGQSSISGYNHNQIQQNLLHQIQQQQASPNTMPQDLSKTSYSMFYPNPR